MRNINRLNNEYEIYNYNILNNPYYRSEGQNFKIFNILLFFIIAFTFTSNEQSYAHKKGGRDHGPITCKLPEDYSLVDRVLCDNARKNHKL